MKKLVVHILSVVALFATLTSCESYLDINDNPNAAERVDPRLLFSHATISYANVRSGGDFYIPIGLGGQTLASGGNAPRAWGIPSEEQYQFDAFSTGNTWSGLYTTVGGNLKRAIALAESATPANNNAAAQSKVLLAFAVYDATMLFGDIPYAEAWNPDITYPKFDPQQDVLNGIIALLDQAIAQFDEASPLKVSEYDLFYKGDIAKWKRIARSAKLRVLMTMVDKDPSKAAQIAQMINAGGMINSAADNFLVTYEETSGRRNPKYGLNLQYNNGLSFFFGPDHLVNFMNGLNDPRLPLYYDKPAAATQYVGVANGEDASDNVNPRIAASLHRANAPEVFFTYQEQLFYEAEIQARGIGVPVNMANANTLYKRAVAESAKFYGVAAGTADNFAASLPVLSSVNAIHMQHWVDKMDRPLDAFTQWRRSGPEGQEVPALDLPTGAPAGPLFRRYPYPITNELAVNPNAPKETRYYYDKVWFDL